LPDVQSQLALPLTVKDRLVGVLTVESEKPNAFNELDEVLLRIVGNQAATAIDNARTYQLVERLGRLKRFFSPQLAELIIRGGADDPLKTHRREVTVVFLDLRGFTPFAETSEPEEVMGVLREYHAEMGKLILAHEGTLERFTGDGMMIFFNDPLPVPDAGARAARMAVAMRDRAAELAARWHRSGYELDLGIGVAKGFATIGAIGFEGRWDYGAIGTVTNLAARLCAEAKPGQILISPRLLPEVEQILEVEEVGPLAVKGMARPVRALNIVRLRGRG
jgi:class 3 adenylate cyclase